MAAPVSKPVPVSSALSQTYWDGIRAGRLMLQSCTGCGCVRHYPRLLCDRCYNDDVKWIAASGSGTIHSWTVAHHPYHAAFTGELPYTLVIVDLEEGPRALGRWRGDTPRIGQPVAAQFVPREDTGHELYFAPT